MADHEARGFQADRYFLGRSQAPQAQVLIAGVWEYRPELIRRREVYWIIQTWVRTHAALKATRSAIDLAQQLHLQPALVTLNGLRWFEGTREFGDANKADGCNEVDKALGDSDE